MGTNGIFCFLALVIGADRQGTIQAKAEPLPGMVYAADRSPAAGAVVWAAKISYGPLERRETVADAKGRFQLDLPPGSWYLWALCGSQGAQGPGLHQTVEIVAGGKPESIKVYLEEQGRLRGRLLEAETGKPIAGGQLYLDNGVVLATDAGGRFEIGGLIRGHHESLVVAPGRQRLRILFDNTASADTELEVSVPCSAKIIGRVTDTNGKPIPGASVGRSTSGTFFSLNGLYLACDADGKFEYDDAVPPDEPTRLTAQAPGHIPGERNDLLVPPDGKLEVNFQLRLQPDAQRLAGAAQAQDEEKRRVVSGIVRGPDNKPVAEVVVRWGYQPTMTAIQTRTDAAGRFRLTVPDKPDILAVLPREFPPEFPNIPASGDKEVEVELHAGDTARGRVVDDTGKPIKDVQVIAVVPSPDPMRTGRAVGVDLWRSGDQSDNSAEATRRNAAAEGVADRVELHRRHDLASLRV